MPRHSKNNTASSVFTYHESHTLEYGTKRQRLGRDSYRDYNACFLCLQVARDPVSCGEGHLACRECMYESILQQKQDIKREQRQVDQKRQEFQNQKESEQIEAKRALLDDFDKTQNSMLGGRHRVSHQAGGKDEEDVNKVERGGTKRKFELSTEEIHAIAEKDLEKATIKLQDEKSQAAKPKLASFWVPELTPAAGILPESIKPQKTTVQCHAVEKAHPLSIKSLIDVQFTTEDGKKEKNICPACLKTLTNSSKLSVMRTCGHVICNPCVDMFVKKAKQCYVCEKKIKTKDIVDMSPEGTGFASGSTKAMAEKFNLAFQ
ncbi:hypothetical protein K501DRAFT_237024 [Backusella circina FSU 941]|nr:hypothetical protein K501DRAFT_237024 [Backusella circina FSU 941]